MIKRKWQRTVLFSQLRRNKLVEKKDRERRRNGKRSAQKKQNRLNKEEKNHKENRSRKG